MDNSTRPWISLDEAAELGAFKSRNALQLFLHRWNSKHPEFAVLRRYGVIERQSFLQALREDALEKTPAARVAQQMGASIR